MVTDIPIDVVADGEPITRITPSQLGTGKAVICPTDAPEMMGCGAVVTGLPDWEGFYDCPNCGLFFKSPA
ncbi:MAG: hypothetical protein PHE17_17650 [Thiothrix sp.]|uniref:hypothetical protein n=1 Tax=Thiothrix sp. TaxID=1032 RepID=UPI002614FAA0|nr:hypothetical protein [Thiothrix sp.]MDD5394846.1 hypothetical protein [Thiothrix sp.]